MCLVLTKYLDSPFVALVQEVVVLRKKVVERRKNLLVRCFPTNVAGKENINIVVACIVFGTTGTNTVHLGFLPGYASKIMDEGKRSSDAALFPTMQKLEKEK